MLTAELEDLTPAGRRWVERAQRPLDLLALVFLVNMILSWSFPDGSPAFLHAMDCRGSGSNDRTDTGRDTSWLSARTSGPSR